MASDRNPSNPDDTVGREHSIRYLRVELAVVLAFAVLPSLYSVALRFTLRANRPGLREFSEFRNPSMRWASYGAATLSDVGIAAVLLFVIWRSREPWSQFGLTRPRWEIDIVAGMAIYLVYGIVRCCGDALLSNAPAPNGNPNAFSHLLPVPTPLNLLILLLVHTGTIGFTEELLFRGYLLTRLERLLGSTKISLIVTSLLFALVHGNPSIKSFVWHAIAGAYLGALFCWRRKLWPIAIAHMLLDFVVATRVEELAR